MPAWRGWWAYLFSSAFIEGPDRHVQLGDRERHRFGAQYCGWGTQMNEEFWDAKALQCGLRWSRTDLRLVLQMRLCRCEWFGLDWWRSKWWGKAQCYKYALQQAKRLGCRRAGYTTRYASHVRVCWQLCKRTSFVDASGGRSLSLSHFHSAKDN